MEVCAMEESLANYLFNSLDSNKPSTSLEKPFTDNETFIDTAFNQILNDAIHNEFPAV